MVGQEKLYKKIYIGPYVHPETLDTLHFSLRAAIGVNEFGTIAFIHRITTLADLDQCLARTDVDQPGFKQSWDEAEQVVIKDGSNSFFFPGFIDTHIHAPQYPNSGIFGKSTLLDWLQRYTFPLEASFSDLRRAQQVYSKVVSRTLSHGTTTAAYFATTHVDATNLLADTCLSKGQRAFIGRVCMDASSQDYYGDHSADVAISDTKKCIEHILTIDPYHRLITPIITPRFAPSCSEDCMKRLGKLHKSTGYPIQTHISENKDEIKMVKTLFPDAKNYASVYDRAGLLTEKTILAHAVHLDDDEVEMVRARKSKVSHCPISNSAISSGIAPVRKLLNQGIDIGLGTDVSGGYSPSILAVARHAILVSNHLALQLDEYNPGRSGLIRPNDAKLSTAEALYLATHGGAKVVNMENKIGGIAVGMKWDAQLISLKPCGQDDFDAVPVDIFGSETFEEMVDKWVYIGDDRNTVGVWVNGHLVHQTRGLTEVTTSR